MSKKTTSAKAQSKGGKKAKAGKPRIKVVGDEAPTQQTAPETAPAAEPAATTVKKSKKAKGATPKADGKMSGLDAAAKVLADAGEPLNCRAIAERAIAQGLWSSNGATPHQTLYSAMLRECQKKGTASRFRKAERGKFASAK